MTEATRKPRAITRELAALAANARFAALPVDVRKEAARTFLNWLGCVLGGCHDAAVESAVATVVEAGGNPQASIIGHGLRTDISSAAFVNCMSSTVNSFDDTHLVTITHPTGPVAAAAFAFAEKNTVSGEDFVTAIALGVEIVCRMSNVLLLPPAQANLDLFVTGLSCPLGAAAALGRLMRLDEKRMTAAIGLAAAQAAGLRGARGAMSAFLVPAHAARTAVSSAVLAEKGFTCREDILEGERGFVDVFGRGGDLGRAVNGWGQHFEIFGNAYKPYPSGIMVQAATDACLDVAQQLPVDTSLASVNLTLPPMALNLCGLRDPRDPVEAQISVFHWAAAVLLQRAAGLAQLRQESIDDPAVSALRARVTAVADPSLARDEAIAEVTLVSGASFRSHVRHARGSTARPMTDDELDAKFLAQAQTVLSHDASERLLRLCRDVATLQDVGREIGEELVRGASQ